jgi:hypothetical protein
MATFRENSYAKIEEQSDEGVTRMKFIFLVSGLPTGNGRVYPEQVVRKAAKEFNARVEKQGSVYGGAEHPKGSPELPWVSHMIEGIDVDDKGQAWARVKLLNTRAGHDLGVILRAGGKIGVSARGSGSETKDEAGHSVVGSDYRLEGADFVLSPSVDKAWVGREHFLESAPMEDPVQNSVLEERFLEAERLAGFRGTFEEYKAAQAVSASHQDAVLEERYLRAKTPWGGSFRGTFAEYKAAVLDSDIRLTEAGGELTESAEETDENDLSEAEMRALVTALIEAVEARFGSNVQILDMSMGRVLIWHPDKSERFEMDYQLNKDGVVELVGNPEPSELDELPQEE